MQGNDISLDKTLGLSTPLVIKYYDTEITVQQSKALLCIVNLSEPFF